MEKEAENAEARSRKNWRNGLGIICIAMLAIIIILIVIFAGSSNRASKSWPAIPSVSVRTDCGYIVGKDLWDEGWVGRRCFEFGSIPYASPPVGERRWKRPVLMRRYHMNCFDGNYSANTKAMAICPQFKYQRSDFVSKEVIGEEDCLYLSIRSPNLTAKLPVFVWIHGGELKSGHKDELGYSADCEFATAMQFVTVNINYRLGPLGFISLKELWTTTPGDESFGDFGFWDQIVALQWISINIANFGGNPEQVTIAGEGASVLALLSSPLANNLFRGAIAQSPTEARLNYSSAAERHRMHYLTNLACERLTSEESKYCLYIKSTVETLQALDDRGDRRRWLLPLPGVATEGQIAVLDPVLMPLPPSKIASASLKPVKDIPVLISSMAQEVGIENGPVFGDGEWQKMRDYVASYLDAFNTSLAEHVFEYYPNRTSNEVAMPPQLIYETLTTDIRLTCEVNRIAQGMGESSHHRVYRMYINHHPSSPLDGRRFAFHTWDTYALFGLKGLAKASAHDRTFTEFLRSTFRKFVLDGELDERLLTYPTTSGNVQQKQCSFWKSSGLDMYSL